MFPVSFYPLNRSPLRNPILLLFHLCDRVALHELVFRRVFAGWTSAYGPRAAVSGEENAGLRSLVAFPVTLRGL